ncbi:unnamed protein product, partial [Laminaria digitata]
SLVIYGGDDQTTNEVGGLGDLWVYSPWASRTNVHAKGGPIADEWTYYDRRGDKPGERRSPSMTMVDSTLLMLGGKVVDGEMNEQCDSRLFLLDLADPDGKWREGASFPGVCGLGQTMNTVKIPMDEEKQVRAVVFGGCRWGSDGKFTCSNNLHAYDLEGGQWEEISPKSDADAGACAGGSDIDPNGTVNLDRNVAKTDVPDTAATPTPTTATITTTTKTTATDAAKSGSSSSSSPEPVVCPGISTPRPLGRHAHAAAYIESKVDSVNALFVFGGRENAEELTPLGDLWMFDFTVMRWIEITPGSKEAPANRFGHSLTVWKGGAGDGVASLVVFGGETIGRADQAVYMNDVWLYTPHTGRWREVSRSECQEGATGIIGGGEWTALLALVSLLSLVVIVQCLLH